MNREDARKAAEVMQAYADGAEIEVAHTSPVSIYRGVFQTCENPSFTWDRNDYRVKQTPDSINWDHVAPEYKWMVRIDSGEPWLFENRPLLHNGNYWCRDQGDSARASCISSYKRGTVDWKDSLVERPSGEGSA
ncbi:hypothetical protein [Roseibium sp.]|uniref:hypothetical protein n=1 Tax=Roseibium sp. TaxID=1936156 RepID=UPI003B52970E